MANANGSGTPAPQDDDSGPIERTPAMQEVVDRWFPDQESGTDQPQMRVLNETARRMEEQRAKGEPTTGRSTRRGCPLAMAVPALVAVLLVRAVTR